MRILLFALFCSLAAQESYSQEVGQRRAALGLSAVGHIGYHAGYAALEHDARAAELGLSVDLGHLPRDRFRVFAEISALRTVGYSEYVAQEDRTYSRPFFDLSGNVGLSWLTRHPAGRVVPYLAIGAGVHALSSSVGSIPIDRRYNSNNFGLLAATGLRTRLRAGGRSAVAIEIRRIQVHSVSRSSVSLGLLHFFGSLARPTQQRHAR